MDSGAFAASRRTEKAGRKVSDEEHRTLDDFIIWSKKELEKCYRQYLELRSK